MLTVNRLGIIKGGLVAGIVLILMEAVLMTFLRPTWLDLVRQMGGQMPGAIASVGYAVILLVLGIVTIWLYAAIRARYGPGPRTAARAGLAVWIIGWGVGFGSAVTLGIFPAGFVAIVLGWGLLECLAAALAGGVVYTEGPGSGVPAD